MLHDRTTSRRRVAVFLKHSLDVDQWRERHRAGETLDATPYGYELAEQWFDMSWARSHRESPWMSRVRVGVANRLGFDIVHAVRNRRVLFAADMIWTHTESEHLAVALLQRLVPRYRRTKLLAQSIWLWDRWPAQSRARRMFHAWLLRQETLEATHSPVNLQASREWVPGRRVVLVPFGSQTLHPRSVVTDSTDDDGDVDVVAPGNDEHRDWSTLADVARMRPSVRFWVASSSQGARAQDWPANVRVERLADAGGYTRLMSRAKVCVVALKDNRHASGMTTCIEASSVSTPLVIAGDGGLRTVIGPGPQYVEQGDAAGIAGAIDRVLGDHGAGREAAVPDLRSRGLTQRDYVTRYAVITDMACGDRPWSEEASGLVPQHRSAPSAD